MARNPLSFRRAPNLLKTTTGYDSRSKFKDIAKEFRIIGAQAMNSAVEDVIKETEAQSRSLPPSHLFLAGRRVSTPNLLKATSISFDHRPEIVASMLADVTQKKPFSPFVSGDYRANFKLFVGGAEASAGQIKYGVRCEIVNVSDYARTLEVGFGEDGKPFVHQVMPHIVERIATHMAKSAWRGIAKFKFNFTSIPDPYILSIKTRFHEGRGVRPGFTKKDRRGGMPINYPTIVIEL